MLNAVLCASLCSPQSNSVLIQERWWTERARCALKQVLPLEQWSVSHVTRDISWRVPAKSPAMDETLAPPNGVTAAQSVSVSPALCCCLFMMLFGASLELTCKFMTVLCVFLCALNSKIWPVPKPWCPWQWLPNLVQAQLPGRRNSAFLLLWRLRAYWWGHYQLCPRPSLSVEQPTTILQR